MNWHKMNWQPISTAPRDGTEILIYQHGHALGFDIEIAEWDVECGYWVNRNWIGEYQHPTHWLPLSPPEVEP